MTSKATPDDLFLHEQIMLLSIRDEKGTFEYGAEYSMGLAGAILAELLLIGRLTAVDDARGKHKLAHVVSDAPTGDDVMDECLQMVASSKPRALPDWVGRFAGIKELKHRVARRLCARGILRADEDSILFIFSRRVYPEIDPAPERAIVERLRAALFDDDVDVDPLTAILMSIANATGLLRTTFERKTVIERRHRIEQVVNGELSGKATQEAIEAMQAAMFVATIIPMFAVTTVAT